MERLRAYGIKCDNVNHCNNGSDGNEKIAATKMLAANAAMAIMWAKRIITMVVTATTTATFAKKP